MKTQVDDLERRWLLAEEQSQRVKSPIDQHSQVIERKVSKLSLDLKLGDQNVKRAFETD